MSINQFINDIILDLIDIEILREILTIHRDYKTNLIFTNCEKAVSEYTAKVSNLVHVDQLDASLNEILSKNTTKLPELRHNTITTKIHQSPNCDIFGNPTNNNGSAKISVKCPNCHRILAPIRFAPHLEKCMGRGRSSVRTSSSLNYFE